MIGHRLTREQAEAELARVTRLLDASPTCIRETVTLTAGTRVDLRAFVPGRLDEVAGIYGPIVAAEVLRLCGEGRPLAALGYGHLYDNAPIEEQAGLIGRALLPVSVRFPDEVRPPRSGEQLR